MVTFSWTKCGPYKRDPVYFTIDLQSHRGYRYCLNFQYWGGTRSMVCKVHWVAYNLFKMPWGNAKIPGVGEDVLDSTLSFFFVRHPFVRLVSAYQDKGSWNSNNYTVIQFKDLLFLIPSVRLSKMHWLTNVYVYRLRTMDITLACPLTKNQTTMGPSSSENLSRDSCRG